MSSAENSDATMSCKFYKPRECEKLNKPHMCAMDATENRYMMDKDLFFKIPWTPMTLRTTSRGRDQPDTGKYTETGQPVVTAIKDSPLPTSTSHADEIAC